MNINIKYPATEDGIMIFYDSAAKARLQLIKDYIFSLPISFQNKTSIFELYKEEIRKIAESELKKSNYQRDKNKD